jgi:Flp pilus assembly protein TadB
MRETAVGSNAMTVINDITKLDNYEDEEIFDVVIKLEKSFGLKFEKDAFYKVQTFGDLCDVYTNNLQGDNSEDCTTQQAFYKVRNAIATTHRINTKEINLATKLQEIFPRDNRRKKIRQLQEELDIKLNMLGIKSWLGWTIFVGIVISLILFFFKWQFAVTGLLFFIALGWTAYKFFAKELKIATVRELTQILARENYAAVRRMKGTVNKQEILKVIIDTFSDNLDIDKAYLTRNEKFSWAT